MNVQEFNTIADQARTSLRVDDFDDLLAALRQLRPRTVVGLRGYGSTGIEGGRDKLAEVEFVDVEGERVILRDTALTHRLHARTGPRKTTDVDPYDIVALPETKFKRNGRRN